MNTKKLFLIAATFWSLGVGGQAQPLPSRPAPVNPKPQATIVKKIAFNGWDEAYTINNGIVEATVVPAVGRIMQFKYVTDVDGPFWSDFSLEGTMADPKSNDWANFGGDKSWPAPQADWPKVTKRSWPPPVGFDSMPAEVRTNANSMTLLHAVDPDFGIQATRQITLEPGTATMKVATTYTKLAGAPLNVSIWTITQLKHPEAVFMAATKTPLMAEGYLRQSENLPENLNVDNGLISLSRGKTKTAKIGTAAEAMVWAGKEYLLKISQPRVANQSYPDGGSSAEVYTNGDPFAYVELEVLGPLQPLKKGEKMEITTSYELHKRSGEPLVKQVRGLLGLK